MIVFVWIVSLILIISQIVLFLSHHSLKYKAIPVYGTVFCFAISFAALLVFEKISGDYRIVDTLTWYVAICIKWTIEVAFCWGIYGIVKLIQKHRK